MIACAVSLVLQSQFTLIATASAAPPSLQKRPATASPKFQERFDSDLAAAKDLEKQNQTQQAEAAFKALVSLTQHSSVPASLEVRALNALAGFYGRCKRYEDAKPAYAQSVALARSYLPNQQLTADVVVNFANFCRATKDFQSAVSLYDEQLNLERQTMKPTDSQFALDLLAVCDFLIEQKQGKKAEELVQERLAAGNLTKADYQVIAAKLNDLSDLYSGLGLYVDSERVQKQQVAILRKYAKNAEQLVSALNDLVVVGFQLDKSFEIENVAQECYEFSKQSLGAEHPRTLRAMKHLAMVYSRVGRKDEAEKMEFEALRLREKVLEPNNPSIATSLTNCANIFSERGQHDEALKYMKRALAIRIASGGEDDERTIESKANIGTELMNQAVELYKIPAERERASQLLKEAEKILTDALAINLKLGRTDTNNTLYIRKVLSTIYFLNSNDAKQEEMSKQVKVTRLKSQGSWVDAVHARTYEKAESFWKPTVIARIRERHKFWQTVPAFPPAYAEAIALESKGDLDGALKKVNSAFAGLSEFRPLLMQGHWLAGDLLCQKGEHQESDAQYQKALELANAAGMDAISTARLLESATLNKQLSNNDENLLTTYERIATLRQGSGLKVEGSMSYLDRALRMEKLSEAGADNTKVCLLIWRKMLRENPASNEMKAYGFNVFMTMSYVLARHTWTTDEARQATEGAATLAREQSAPGAERATRLLDVCAVLFELGDYGKAQQLAADALAESERGKDNQLTCESLLTSAHLSLAQGDYSQAMSFSERAVAVSDATSTRQLVQALELLCESASLAGSTANDGKLIDKALDSAKRALKIQEELNRPAANKARLLTAIARLQKRKGQLAEAKDTLQKAVSLCRPLADGESRMTLADSLQELATLQLLERNYAESRESVCDALEIHIDSKSGVSVADQIRDLDLLAIIDGIRGDTKGAREEALQAAAKLDSYVQTVLPELSMAEQRAFLDTIQDTASVLAAVCTDQESLPKAYSHLLRWKGLLVEGLRKQSQLGMISGNPKYEKLVAELRELRKNIASASSGKSTTPEQASELTSRKEELERQLPGVKDAAAGITVADFQKQLAADESLVDILTYRNLTDGYMHYAAVISSQSGPIQFVELGAAASINHAIGEWRNTGIFASGTRDVTLLEEDGSVAKTASARAGESWTTLKNSIWNPISEALPKTTTRLFICEDGELARVPWNMFVINAAANNLLLCHVDSPRELIALKKSAKIQPQNLPVLVAGAIKYRNPQLTLPGAAQEVSDIQQIAATSGLQANVLTQLSPTREAIIKSLGACRNAHLATHGFFTRSASDDTDKGLTSLGARAMIVNSMNAGHSGVDRNPLVRSGILLAPAADDKSGEEARLTAEELVGIDLGKCDLLTLSACDTGRGEEVTGQGVMGLRSAIMAGGARSVLLSLWPVDDEATRALMRHFYTNLWQKKMNKAQALKAAQQSVKTDPQHPSWKLPTYWSGWQLVGEGWR